MNHFPFHRAHLLIALAAATSGFGGCCGSGANIQLRRELQAVRDSEVVALGTIELPPFANPGVVDVLVAGSSEDRIVALVGPPWRRLPAREGELWVWDMQTCRQNVSLAINMVDGYQRGDAAAEWRKIPNWGVCYSLLSPGMEVEKAVDYLGCPTRWEVYPAHSFMIWEDALPLEHEGSGWRYSRDAYLHSLRLEVVDDRIQFLEPIVSRRLDDWPSGAAQPGAAPARASRGR